jgi:hypothetical protein
MPCEENCVDRRFMKRLLMLMFCYSLVLVLIVGAFMAGILSPRGVGIAVLLSAVGMFFVLLRFFKKANEARTAGLSPADAPTRQQMVRRTYVCGASTMMFILGAIAGFPDLRSVPIYEQISLVGVSLMLISTSGWAFYLSLKRLKEQ